MPQSRNEEFLVNGIPLPTRNTRRRIVMYTLIYCWSIIAAILYAGDPTNSLHTSALAWAFALSGSTIFAYVFGAVVDNWNTVRALTRPTFTNYDDWYRSSQKQSTLPTKE